MSAHVFCVKSGICSNCARGVNNMHHKRIQSTCIFFAYSHCLCLWRESRVVLRVCLLSQSVSVCLVSLRCIFECDQHGGSKLRASRSRMQHVDARPSSEIARTTHERTNTLAIRERTEPNIYLYIHTSTYAKYTQTHTPTKTERVCA